MKRSQRTIEYLQSLISDGLFISQHRKHSAAFTRQRKLPFATVMGTILRLAKKSLQIECNLLGDRLMSEPASKQAFSKARHNISYSGFKALNTAFLEQAYLEDNTGTWNGLRVLGIDGSTVKLPKSEETIEVFGVWSKTTDNPDKCPVIARISEVVELTTGIIVSAELAPMSFGERRLATDQIREVSTLFKKLNQPAQLYVFDRGYVSKEMMKTILDVESHFLFRIRKGFNSEIDKLVCKGETDCYVNIDGFSKLRLIVRRLPSNEKCVLLTSLIDLEITGDEFYRLYWLRWMSCEEGYRKQKINLQLENFSGISIEVVLQEFWATVVTLNTFLLHCVDEEGPWDPEDPPKSRINRSVIFGSLRDDIFAMLIGKLSISEFTEKFKKVAQRTKVQVKLGRQFSREKTGKPKRHHVYRRTC